MKVIRATLFYIYISRLYQTQLLAAVIYRVY